jgi:type IV secretory pathway VirB2 component (pilin)
MRTASYVLGSAAMLVGVAFIITAVLQVMRRRGAHGLELALLLVTGLVLVLFGRWVIQ